MPPSESQPSPDDRPGMRMKELMARTGLPKSTLLYYVDQGLLPAPVKTSPNMAYYDPVCVERAAFIRDLQTRHRLPLNRIRELLDLRDQGREVSPLVELWDLIFGPEQERVLDREALCRASGLTPAEVEELRRARLLLPLREDGYDQEDLAAALVYARGRERGLRARDLSFYAELGQALVNREMALRQRLTREMPLAQNAATTMDMVQGARALRGYILNRLFQHTVARHDHRRDPGEA